MKTFLPKITEKDRRWFVIDASGRPLGRLAVRIANILRGKIKAIYAPQIDTGDYVIVINAEKVALSGSKEMNKIYKHFSGYRSGLKEIPAHVVRERHPDRMISLAVKRMLPRNMTSRKVMTRLKIYAGDKHPHAAQNPGKIE